MMTRDDLYAELAVITSEAEALFQAAYETIAATGEEDIVRYSGPSHWDHLPDQLKDQAHTLRERVAKFGGEMMRALKVSPLITQADEDDVRLDIRVMMASLLIREHSYSPPYPISEEDRLYGIAPAEHKEITTSVATARSRFVHTGQKLIERMSLMLPTSDGLPSAIVASDTPTVRRYRPNTAFIIMQINSGIPKLEDVKNAFKETFASFGIKAVRSDEIEHQDVITQRILDEIATSEFLVADLTGERPSVYYEVGYAHALHRRPILFRERGTSLHFDLLVHNVPEYENITDLKKRLTDRLAVMTGREAKPKAASSSQ